MASAKGWRRSSIPYASALMSSEPVLSQTVHGIFVGREAELRQLRALFDNAASGEGSLAMVVGEPGIGKTTLCEQLAEYVEQQGGVTLVGHCYEEGSLSLPYLAFVEAMRDYVATRDEDDLRNELGPDAGEVARILPEIRRRMEVEPSPSGDPDQDRYRLLQAVATFLRNASDAQPLLMVLEDLHDADKGTLDMLTYFSRNLGGSRLLIAGTYRDVEVDRAHPLSGTLAELRRASSFERIALRGLNPDEVQRMMAGVAGRDIPWSVAEAVHRQTEGNPLFVQEVVRYLVQEGLLVDEQEGPTGGTPISMSIPEGLRDVVGKRLSRLSPESNRVLGVASVIGREFRLDVLQRVADVSEEELFAALEEAQRTAVIEERTSARVGLAFRFAHAFFRQTLYEETFAPRRIRLHQRVGRVLEEVYAGRMEEHADELAEHFAQSTELEDLEKALTYGEMAAERAMSVFAYAEAARHLDRCLEVQEVINPDDKARRCDLLLALGHALMPAGELQRTHETLAPEALALAEAMDDGARASRACQMALTAVDRYGAVAARSTQEYRQWAERADRYAAQGTMGRVRADLALSTVRGWAGQAGEARSLAQSALELARQLDDPETLFRAAHANLFWQRPQDSILLAKEFADRSRKGVSTGTLGNLLYACANRHLMHGERDRAEELYAELDALVARTQDADLLMVSLVREAYQATLDGRLEEAVARADDIGARGEELGSEIGGASNARMIKLRPLVHLGRGEEAMAAIALFADEYGSVPGASTQGALLHAHLGHLEEARDAIGQFMKQRVIGRRVDLFPPATPLETAVLVEDRESAEVLAKGLSDFAALSMLTTLMVCPGRLLGGAAALLGKPDEAREYYQTALEAAGKIRFRPEVALIRFELAELLLDQFPQERAEALEHLDFAISELRDMKMQPALERAEELLARLEAQPVQKPAYPDGLTQREVEVLRLIIAGASNQQIADALFITTNTVANHVKNILTKSNTANRAEAAAYGVRHGLAEE